MSTTYDIEGKVCIVTGGASGIGKSLCIQLNKSGAKAIVVADRCDGSAFARELNNGIFIQVDVSKERNIADCISKTEKMFGIVDMFFSNAGVGAGGVLDKFNDEAFRNMFDINVMQVSLLVS